MNVLHLAAARSQDLPVVDDQLLEKVKARLLEAQNSINSHRRQYNILDKLATHLFQIYEKGFSFQEIAMLLSRSGIEISADIVERYFNLVHTKRLLRCETTMNNCQRSICDTAVERSRRIEDGLRQALIHGGLELNYQPQVDMNTGVMFGAEALLRWKYHGESICPSELISVAEQTGLVQQIGEWVLREACREAKRWRDLHIGGCRGVKVGVNLSVMQLSDQLVNIVHSALCDVGLPTSLLGIEITESALIANESLPILHSLRESGIQLSMDDFGTGYSCLSELKDLPLKTIKIDRAFVSGLEYDGKSAAIVETIIDLARKLGMETLAEGVETENQSIALKRLGCFMAQGFLYSKPLSKNEFIDFAKNNATTLQRSSFA